jgi:hypothetical protein
VSVFMRVQGNSSNSIYSKVMKMKTTTAYKPPHFTVSVRIFFGALFCLVCSLCVSLIAFFFFSSPYFSALVNILGTGCPRVCYVVYCTVLYVCTRGWAYHMYQQ